ncbi:50S ribosomal protein L18 [Candidatus Parcubacteria bacterium]|nr:50S ribosomal protein L18 [Candidatus Parcubacteria bacterium]
MTNKKSQHRVTRHRRIRSLIKGTSTRPRVAVYKSNQHIFVQVIDDTTGKTLMSSKVVSKKKSIVKGTKTEVATTIGQKVAEQMKEKGINEAVFDRGGFKYHGRVKAVADGLRNSGIKI